mmetsp:Transcript_19351/g.34088  ORF Transcript_19351/g.34088 Transcript_19351/m.34088 type:complete len:85 (+) Transcript_19351:568-822(+)
MESTKAYDFCTSVALLDRSEADNEICLCSAVFFLIAIMSCYSICICADAIQISAVRSFDASSRLHTILWMITPRLIGNISTLAC